MPAVARLHRHVRETCLPYLPDLHTPAEDLAFFQEHVFPASCTIWLAEAEGRLIGFRRLLGRTGSIISTSIQPGTAKAWGRLCCRLRREGQSELNLWTFQRERAGSSVL